MKKIIVIGCPGSGKTTFAEKLRDKLGLPLFYLDAIWHKPDRTHISREEYDLRLGEILAPDEWKNGAVRQIGHIPVFGLTEAHMVEHHVFEDFPITL